MPRKLELSWQAGHAARQGRWTKTYKGKRYYLGHGNSKSDRDSYLRALDEWGRLKASLDEEAGQQPKLHQQEYEAAILVWQEVQRWYREHGDARHADWAADRVACLKRRLAELHPKPLRPEDSFWSAIVPEPWPGMTGLGDIPGMPPNCRPPADPNAPTVIDPKRVRNGDPGLSPTTKVRVVWEDRLKVQQAGPADTARTVQAHATRFLEAKRAEVDAGHLSAGRFAPVQTHLHHFRDWIGETSPIEKVNGRVMADYHSELLRLIAVSALSQDYARDRLTVAKMFVKWLYHIEAIEALPRNIDKLTIAKRLKTPVFFTTQEISQLLEAATDRTRLYLLLMLNTGMQQKDISDLCQSEVDWRAGTITRKRSKTQKYVNVPVVTYKLWRETFRLLKQERSPSGDRVLLNENGGPLKVEHLDDRGRLQKVDNVASAWKRLQKVTKVTKPMKCFRKTSSNLIAQSKEHRGLEDFFLDHAPHKTSSRHYTQEPQHLLDAAIRWLAGRYGLKA